MKRATGLWCSASLLVACAATTPEPAHTSVVVDATPISKPDATSAHSEPESRDMSAPEIEERFELLGIIGGDFDNSAIFQLDPSLSGLGAGPGIGGIGGIGHGLGTGAVLRLGTADPSSAPSAVIRLGRPDPPPTLSRIVRRHFGAIRACYERGLVADPALAGEVRVHLDISSDGAAHNVTSEGSTLPDDDTIECITQVFEAMSFPGKSDALGTVLFPLHLGSPKAPASKP